MESRNPHFRLRLLGFLGLAAPLLLVAAPATAAWFGPGWHFRTPISVQASQVPSDQTSFPVLVTGTDPAWRDVANGGHVAQADGGDLLFTAADGTTQLPYDLERYVPSTGEIVAWVNVPVVSSSSDTDLYLYYGNASAADQADPVNTWSNGFVGVWHLDEDPAATAPQMLDRSGRDNHGTTEGSIPSGASQPAKIGNGLVLDGSDDRIRIPDSASLDSTVAAATISCWIRWTDSSDGNHQIVMTSSNRFTPGLNDGYEWASQGNGNHFFYPWGGDGFNYNLGPDPFTNGVFQHLAVTLDYATTDVAIYVDGSPMSFTDARVDTLWTQLADPDDWLWGGNPDRSDRHLDGALDEIQVSTTVRSADWIQTAFNNQGSPGTFLAFGTEEEHLELVKRAYLEDGTPLAQGQTVPRGTHVKFLIYINNRGDARTDVSVQDVLDPAFVYQASTLQVTNAPAACADSTCTPVEEAAIFAAADAAGALTDAVDGDAVSITAGVIDAGNEVAANAQLDILGNRVWALLATVRFQ